MADFDLTANPFWLLKTSVRARKQDVVDALEAALSDDLAFEAELLRAQQVILAPISRLDAELSWLPDLAPSRAVVVAGTLAANPPKEVALQLLDGIVGLSRANVAAHICRRYPGQVDLIDELRKSYRALSLAEIEEVINASRRIAGISQVHPDLLGDALWKLERQHAECATECLAGSACPGPHLSRILGTTAEPSSLEFGFLAATVRAYRGWVGKRLQPIDDALQAEVSAMKLTPGDPAIAERIHAGIGLWSEWNGPVELWDQANGLEEPRSYTICDKLRDLSIWLANDMAQRRAALAITERLRETFTKLPSMLKLLDEDAITLKRLVDEEAVSESMSALQNSVEEAKASIPALRASLMSSGFSERSKGVVLDLYRAFQIAVASTRDNENADVPWRTIRAVMIELNNQEQREASERLGRDLLAIAEAKATAEFITMLKDDLRTVRSNMKWSEIDYYLKTNRRKAVPLLHALIAEQAPGEDLDQLHKLYMKLQSEIAERNRHNKQRIWKWSVVIVVICLWIAVKSCSDDHDSSSRSTATPTSTILPDSRPISGTTDTPPVIPVKQPPDTLDDGQQTRPPKGSGREFSRDELRYCQFRKATITRARSLSTPDDDLSNFIAAARDYNLRCSSYKYIEDDMTAIKAEVAMRKVDIDRDAQGLLTGSANP